MLPRSSPAKEPHSRCKLQCLNLRSGSSGNGSSQNVQQSLFLRAPADDGLAATIAVDVDDAAGIDEARLC